MDLLMSMLPSIIVVLLPMHFLSQVAIPTKSQAQEMLQPGVVLTPCCLCGTAFKTARSAQRHALEHSRLRAWLSHAM